MAKEEARTDGAERGLTPFGRSLAFAGAALLLLGLAFGSFPYILCALFLLGVTFHARGSRVPALSVTRALPSADVRTGEPVDVRVTVRNDGEAGALSLHDRVPDPFSLDAGSNFAARWLAPGEEVTLAYRLRAPRRGAHEVGALRATAYDPLFLQSAPVAEKGEPSDLVVHPRAPPVARIRTSSAWGRTHLPGGDKAVRGILTNDFRELRPYARGDPLKQVNWKATARMSRDELSLIVNDYEVEGKKVVWIFADASDYTVGGTNLTSHFDEIASGALSVAGHYLDMGHRVGFTLFGNGAPRILYAESGELHERRIAALLATATPGENGPEPEPQPEPLPAREGIARAVEATKGFLAREKPLLFVFTLAGRDPDMPRALVSARALASTGRRPAPIIAVAPILEQDDSVAGRMVGIHERAQLKGLERRGVTVVRYHPSRLPLSALLARGVIR